MQRLEIKQEKAEKAKQKRKSSLEEDYINLHVSQWSKAGNEGSIIVEEKKQRTDSPGFIIFCIQSYL